MQLRLSEFSIKECRHGIMVWPKADRVIGASLANYGEFAEGENRLMARYLRSYEDLWAELNEERKHAAGGSATKVSWPARPDPFAAFEAYPTHILTEATLLEATAADADALCQQVEAMRTLAMVNFAKVVLPTPDEVRLVLTTAVTGPSRAVDLVRDIPKDRRAHVFRGLGWLMKVGALRLAGGADLNLAQTAGSDAAKRS